MTRLSETIVQSEKSKRGTGSSEVPLPIKLYAHHLDSPLGCLTLAVNRKGAVVLIEFGKRTQWPGSHSVEFNKYACGDLSLQLDEYFAGTRKAFDLDLAPSGSVFQLSVWEKLLKLSWGTTVSYAELARRLGRRGAARAVASAVAANPIPLIIPCHRVIMSNGSMGKYALRSVPEQQGCDMKRYLLAKEGLSF